MNSCAPEFRTPHKASDWQTVGQFRPTLRRRLSIRNRLTARLFRDGFHAMAASSSGAIVAAVPGAIVTCAPGQTEFRQTHLITRGTRPLHIAAVPGGAIFWGEYFDNASRDEVHIYASTDAGEDGASPTPSPKDPFATCTTSSTIHGPTVSGF